MQCKMAYIHRNDDPEATRLPAEADNDSLDAALMQQARAESAWGEGPTSNDSSFLTADTPATTPEGDAIAIMIEDEVASDGEVPNELTPIMKNQVKKNKKN